LAVAGPLLELVDIARYYQMGDEKIARSTE